MVSAQLQQNRFDYAHSETPDSETADILQEIPVRWGRMPALSRALVVEAGRTLQSNGFLDTSRNLEKKSLTVGLIGGTRRGSLSTDIAFGDSLKQGIGLASPALFGYTLANIPLAEAANHYGLIGPVYAIIDNKEPFSSAQKECERILIHSDNIDFMLACSFDEFPSEEDNNQLQITFTCVQRT